MLRYTYYVNYYVYCVYTSKCMHAMTQTEAADIVYSFGYRFKNYSTFHVDRRPILHDTISRNVLLNYRYFIQSICSLKPNLKGCKKNYLWPGAI